MDYVETTRRKIKDEKELLKRLEKRLRTCPPGRLKCVKVHGKNQYYHIISGQKEKYINKEHAWLVNELKYKRILQESVKRLRQNILLEEKMVRGILPYDYPTVSSQLPATYREADVAWHSDYCGRGTLMRETQMCEMQVQKAQRQSVKMQGNVRFTQSENPYRRENLTQPTTFGLVTRSRGESMYAEQLYGEGFTFYYERELVLQDENGIYHQRYPDFTIPLADGHIYYLEHKGMMQNEAYRARDEETMRLYHLNGIFEPKNLIVTKDGPDGVFPADDIARMIQCVLVPLK